MCSIKNTVYSFIYIMIFLFTGEERFLLKEKLNLWKNKFLEKYWNTNLYIFSADNINSFDIINLMLWWGLFDDKKLIIIYGIPKDSVESNKADSKQLKIIEDFLLSNISAINWESIIVFVSYKPDKRTKLYKLLQKTAKIEEFKLLSEKKLIEYISNYLDCSNTIWKEILNKTWTDLTYIHNEISKLKLLLDSKIIWQIDKQSINKYITTKEEAIAFNLLDNIWTEKSIKILQTLEKNKKDNNDIFQILWLLFWHLKTILLVLDQKLQSVNDTKSIASAIKAHPFVVSRILKRYSTNSIDSIKNFLKQIIQLNYDLVRWQIDINFAFLELKKYILQYKI